MSTKEDEEIAEMLQRDRLVDELQSIFFPDKQYVLGKNHRALWKAVDVFKRYSSQKALEARIDEINRFFDHTMSKDWQDNATYSDNRIAALKQESEG